MVFLRKDSGLLSVSGRRRPTRRLLGWGLAEMLTVSAEEFQRLEVIGWGEWCGGDHEGGVLPGRSG